MTVADFGAIEKKLNGDPRYRTAFLQNPVSVLLAEGVFLTPQNQQKLLQSVARLQNRPTSGVGNPASISWRQAGQQPATISWTPSGQQVAGGSPAAGSLSIGLAIEIV